MASASHRRPPGKKRRTGLAATGTVAVALLVSLVVASLPDGTDKSDSTEAVSVAGAQVSVVSPKAPASSPTPSKASPTATARATKTPSATPTTASARPSAKPASRAASATAPLAGRIRPGTTYKGVATHYDAGNGDGACLYGPTSDLMVAAMNTADYETSKACGAYIRIRASSGASVTVRIVNECPSPCAPGQLDLSQQAFAKLANLSAGRIAITWTLLSPSTSDTISIRYKTGSSQYWCGIQALGHRNPLARLEVRTGSSWRQLARTGYNYFLSEQGAGCGGTIRITDIYGEQLTVSGIALRPDAVQKTRLQFAAH